MRRDEKGILLLRRQGWRYISPQGRERAASEVAGVINAYPGIYHANVYGVGVPGIEGRVGMAAIVAMATLDLPQFHAHIASLLPRYARPVFLRISKEPELTGTFKYSKTELVREGYNPGASGDLLYFDDPAAGEFVPLDAALYRCIQGGA